MEQYTRQVFLKRRWIEVKESNAFVQGMKTGGMYVFLLGFVLGMAAFLQPQDGSFLFVILRGTTAGIGLMFGGWVCKQVGQEKERYRTYKQEYLRKRYGK